MIVFLKLRQSKLFMMTKGLSIIYKIYGCIRVYKLKYRMNSNSQP